MLKPETYVKLAILCFVFGTTALGLFVYMLFWEPRLFGEDTGFSMLMLLFAGILCCPLTMLNNAKARSAAAWRELNVK